MEKINIAELLKDCPKGMELDCTMFEGIEFDGIVDAYFPIRCRIKHPDGGCNVYNFTEYGCWNNADFSKCVIFPKGKTTWEGFQRPFKDGDIITDSLGTCIFKGEGKFEGTVDYYCGISNEDIFSVKDNKLRPNGHYGFIVNYRLATEEEKQKLFAAIKEHGYKWNAETKTLEKLNKPRFKVGDKVRYKKNHDVTFTITSIGEDAYANGVAKVFWFDDQDKYELVPDKFDITILIPFESRVLVRDCNSHEWEGEIYTRYTNKSFDNCNFVTLCGRRWKQCIPYNDDTKHLLGTTNDCDEYYKTW